MSEPCQFASTMGPEADGGAHVRTRLSDGKHGTSGREHVKGKRPYAGRVPVQVQVLTLSGLLFESHGGFPFYC